MSQPGSQTVAIHMLRNISQSKGKQNITRQIFFFRNYAENELWRLVPDPFLFFNKSFI